MAKGAPFRGLAGRLIVAGCLLLALIGASFGVLVLAIDEVRSADAQVSSSFDRLRAVDRIEQRLIEMEAALDRIRSSTPPGPLDELVLRRWTAARGAFLREVTTLAASVVDPVQAMQIGDIEAAGRTYIEQYADPLVDAYERGSPRREIGANRAGEVRSLLGEFYDLEHRAYLVRQEAANQLAGAATLSATVALLASVGLITLFIAYLVRTMVRPVAVAAHMADRLAMGELSVRMRESGRAEIGVLERSLNSLAASLQAAQAAQARFLERESAVRRVATLVAEDRPPERIFGAVVRELADHLPCEFALLWRQDADGRYTSVASWESDQGPLHLDVRVPVGSVGPATEAWKAGLTVGIDDLAAFPGPLRDLAQKHRVTDIVGSPVVVAGTWWGALLAARSAAQPVADEADDWIRAFTELVGLAIANAEARADVAASRARIVGASDEARRRIERNLHDGAQQRLVSLALRLRTVDAMVPDEQAEVHAGLRLVDSEVTGAIEELREISRGIYPASLSRSGLAAAVRALVRRSTIPIQLEVRSESRFDESVEVAGYYVVAEALANAAKHASAQEIFVTLVESDGLLRVTVRDDGEGGADPARGSGLMGLRDRVEALGGRLELTTTPGVGTSVVARIPVGDAQEP